MIKRIVNSELFHNAGIYTFFNVLEKAIPFVLLPILTRYLTTTDYGIVSMFWVLVGLIYPLINLGTHSGIMRVYYKKKEDFSFPSYVGNSFIILFGTVLVAGLFLFLFADIISAVTSFPADWLLAVLMVAVMQHVTNLILIIWQAKFKPISYGVFTVILSTLNVSISILYVVVLGYNWEGRVIGYLISLSVMVCIALYVLWKEDLINLNPVKKNLIHLLKFGAPLLPHMLSIHLISMVDRVFITNMVGISETGIYTVGYQIGLIIGVLAIAFNKAWVPWFYKNLNKKSEAINRRIVKISYLYFFGISVLAVLLSFLAPLFMQILVGENFYGATIFIIWIAVGYAFKGMYYMVTNYMTYAENTLYLSFITIFALIINIVLNYYFIKRFGAVGAAQATTVTYLVQFLCTWILAAKVYKMPWLNPLKNHPKS